MATPSATRPHSGSTPKNTSIATPTSVMPSPRPPTSAAMARSLPHNLRSPATKTPASGHGHSHPSSTPLPALAPGEDALNFNSPAAMMMSSLGSHGLTPLPSGADGLGISADLNAVTRAHGAVLGARNPEEDKLRRLQEVLKLLRTRVAGRGICREGVERLAQLAGFTHMWQGDTLAIAGTCVDLEVTFDGIDIDRVKDVALNIFTPEFEQQRTDAADVLKSNLEPKSPCGSDIEPWRSLECFATNLQHLGKMDNLSQGINCFEAIDGLYHTFTRIWEGEQERTARHRTLDRLNKGIIGRPVLNRKAKLGLGLEYWTRRTYLAETEPSSSKDKAAQADHPRCVSDPHDAATGIWTACIDCEAGYPSLRVSREWIAESIWANNGGNGDRATKETTPTVAWVEPPPTLIRPADTVNESNADGLAQAEIRLSKPPEVRFTANLEPAVLVPLSVASSVLNRQGLSVALEHNKFTTYDQALRNLAAAKSQSKGVDPLQRLDRWIKPVGTFDEDGQATVHQHSYNLYSAPQIWCYPVQSITFDHPERLAELLPTLRQYALLWSLLSSTVSLAANTGAEAVDQAGKDMASTGAPEANGASKKGRIRRTNIDPRRAEVNALLRDRSYDARSRSLKVLGAIPADDPTVPLPVDISLSLTSASSTTPKLDLIWPLPTKPNASNPTPKAAFGSLTIEIAPNGEIAVPSAVGIPLADGGNGLRLIARGLASTEDLALVVEWVMKKAHS